MKIIYAEGEEIKISQAAQRNGVTEESIKRYIEDIAYAQLTDLDDVCAAIMEQ